MWVPNSPNILAHNFIEAHITHLLLRLYSIIKTAGQVNEKTLQTIQSALMQPFNVRNRRAEFNVARAGNQASDSQGTKSRSSFELRNVQKDVTVARGGPGARERRVLGREWFKALGFKRLLRQARRKMRQLGKETNRIG